MGDLLASKGLKWKRLKNHSHYIISSAQTDAFDQDCLDAHNIYRAKHSVPPLLWSQKLKEDAQRWANHLADLGDLLQHDGTKPLNEGENLAHFSPPSEKCYGAKGPGCVQCREIVKDWYDEEADYDFVEGHRKPGAVVLHFTQVDWFPLRKTLLWIGLDRKMSCVRKFSARTNGFYTKEAFLSVSVLRRTFLSGNQP